jgi:AraC-like DNA-binding protein
MQDDRIQIPTFYVQQILEQLEHKEVDVERWLRRHHLNREMIIKQNSLISLGVFKQLVSSAISLSGEPQLGLLVGKRLGLTTHGMLGFAVMASRNLAEALDLISRYLNIRTPLLQMKLVDGPELVTIQLSENYDLADIKNSVFESTVCALINMLAHIAPELTAVEHIRFPFAAPDDTSLYQRNLNSTVTFGGQHAEISISKWALDVSLVMGNETALANARELCEAELQKLNILETFQHRVRVILLSQEQAIPTLSEVADRLHLSARTLHRRLNDETTSFSQILSSIRHLKAINLLGNSRLPIKLISNKLGYSETAGFRKAFKKWTGMTPRDFRNE